MAADEGATAETRRLAEARARTAHWKRWGPYLAERQWGTVREDYSPRGTVWEYFPHDHARSRAYRWGEDGLLGISDNHQRLCFALALWNQRDPILKERLFGLAGPEGNHGEDVKECYFYLDATPTHSYLRALYKYPQREYPYARLDRGERAARARRARVRAPRHRRLRRGPLLRRLRGVREGEPERPAAARHRREPRPGRGAAPRAPDALAPEHVVLGPGRAAAAPARGRGAGGSGGRARGASGAVAGVPLVRRGGAAASCSPRTRRTSGASSGTVSPSPGGRTRSTRRSCTAGRTSSSPAPRGPRSPPTTASRSRPAAGRRCGFAWWTGRRPRRSAPSSTASSPSASRRPTSSTPR